MKYLVLMILGIIFALIVLSQQAVIDECNREDEFGRLVYKDSFICANEHGERIVYEESTE